MQRYFIQFSYFGRKFHGLQKQFHRPPNIHQLDDEDLEELYRADEVTVQVTPCSHKLSKSKLCSV